jgi:hypothetical protein
MSLCVYALVRRTARPVRIRGLGGERLRMVTVGRLDAVVGELARPPKPTLTNLIRYDRILTRLWQATSALLPARFGTFVSSTSELERLLRPLMDVFHDRLAHVSGCAQMTILLADSRQHAPSAPVRQLLSGTEYLREAKNARLTPEFAPVRKAVHQWVRDERTQKRGAIVAIDHLIRRTAVARYRAAAERAAREARLAIRIVGPRSPYAFAGIS